MAIWPAPVTQWGSTPAERSASYPCDALVDEPQAAFFRAVTVDAPPAVVFRRLCQLRVAPYSYDWIDNFGRRSPPELIPGLERLEPGQRFMTLFELVGFEPGRSITLVHEDALFLRVAVTYVVSGAGGGRSRLVGKVVARYRRGPLGWTLRALLPAGDLVMMRRQLLNLAGLAEADTAQ